MSQPVDRLLTASESDSVQDVMGMAQVDVDAMQGDLTQTDARSKNIRLSLIKLAALALAQS